MKVVLGCVATCDYRFKFITPSMISPYFDQTISKPYSNRMPIVYAVRRVTGYQQLLTVSAQTAMSTIKTTVAYSLINSTHIDSQWQ